MSNINIVEVREFSEEELLNKIKQVPMLEDKKTFPYKDSFVFTRTLKPSELTPAQYYVSKKSLDNIIELNFALSEKGYDIFNLNGYLEVVHGFSYVDDRRHQHVIDEYTISILPPIVEIHMEYDQERRNIICDGMHRCFLAKKYFREVKCVVVDAMDIPYYAYPLENGWDDVSFDNWTYKKLHRIKDNKKLYRDFNSVFKNGSVPRGDVVP